MGPSKSAPRNRKTVGFRAKKSAITTAIEGPSSILLDYVQMYQLVVDFKETLSKVFLEKGLLVESSKLSAFKTFPVETHVNESPQVQQLSANVLLVFKLMSELIHAVVMNKDRVPHKTVTADKASQTESQAEVAPRTAVSDANSPVKHEKEADNSDEYDTTIPSAPVQAETPTTTKAPCIPLRKSSRTSVLNRKPFVTPRKASARKSKPPAKVVGAKKRKQGSVRKKAISSRVRKKVVKETESSEPVVKTEVKEETPKRTRRSLVVTNMYERTAEGKFRCKECGKEAKLQTNIRKHLRKHTGEKPYKCTKCPVAFAYPRSLKRHELVHEGIRPYKCSQCDKSFFDPTSLRTHSRVHTDDRPYVCQICGNRFRQNEGLKGHMRSHTGDRPYVCERCGMAFAAKRSLTRHIRVHTGERPYSCDQCVAAFADWTTLHNHKLVHRTPGGGENGGEGQDREGGDSVSENKPFQCQFCGVRYRQPLSLKRHLRLHSPNAVAKKPTPKKPRKRKAEDGEVCDGEEPTALHLQYRPYECEICGEKFKHLRGYETHKNKHESGTLTVKKTQCKRVKRDGVGELTTQDIEQAASILASVAVNSTNLPQTNDLPVSIIHAPQQPSNTVTVIDDAAFNTITNAEATNIHIPTSSTPMVSHATDMIQYTSGNVTQVIQYPDGTLGEVTTLVPHPPPPSIIQPSDLLDSVVTVVFDTRDGNVMVTNQ